MPTKNKSSKKTAKKTAKSQKKVPVKGKKVGKTVTFQAKPKTDPLGKRSLPAFKSDGTPVGKVNVETGVRSPAPAPQIPNRPHPMMACGCGNPNCHGTRQQQPQQIPDFIRQLAEQMGNEMGAQSVMIVGLPLNPANPRNTAPTEAEARDALRKAVALLSAKLLG